MDWKGVFVYRKLPVDLHGTMLSGEEKPIPRGDLKEWVQAGHI